jgi:hypothetical protein
MPYRIREPRRARFAIALSALCASCRQPPPPPAGPPPPQPGVAFQIFSSTGTIRSWNYGPEGDINGFVLDRDTLVMFPPDAAAWLPGIARSGSRAAVSGYSHSGRDLPVVVDARTITVNGQTFYLGAPASGPGPGAAPTPPPPRRRRRPPPPPPGP